MKNVYMSGKDNERFVWCLGLCAPWGAGAGAVAFPAVMQVSAAMSLVVSRHAMSACLFLHRARAHVPLMT